MAGNCYRLFYFLYLPKLFKNTAMIKTNELRRGNFLSDGSGEPAGIGKVEIIWPGTIWAVNPSGFQLTLTQDEAEGIPLTPELLEKCGFGKKHKIVTLTFGQEVLYTTFYYKSINVTTGSMNDWHLMFAPYKTEFKPRIASFKYLHQLQNLVFALTGEELTVNL